MLPCQCPGVVRGLAENPVPAAGREAQGSSGPQVHRRTSVPCLQQPSEQLEPPRCGRGLLLRFRARGAETEEKMKIQEQEVEKESFVFSNK